MISEFPHKPPDGYSYEFEKFNTRVLRIMLRHNTKYDYNLGKSVSTIWGFYSPKKRIYYSPINSTSMGSQVDINLTTPYTSIIPKQSPLEKAFV